MYVTAGAASTALRDRGGRTGSAGQRLLDADPLRWLFTLFPAAHAIVAREVRDEPSCLGLGESVPVDGARGGRMAAC
jgi:hypothetical protein